MSAVLFWLSVGCIVYTYFGYPLLVTVLAHLHPQKTTPPLPHLPNVTLLIAAYNEESVIEAKIQNALALDYPKERLQILVVTDGSDDQTPEIVKRYADQGVDLLHHPQRRGKMAAINRAIPHARGEIVVFSDANNFYHPEALRQLITPFGDPRVGAVSGAKTIEKTGSALGTSEGLYWKYESFLKEQESRLGNCTGVCGEILAIRKEAFSPPPTHIINDDFYIAMQVIRQGYRLVYAPEARSVERVSASARDEVTRRTRINAGRYQAFAHLRHWLPTKHPLLVWQIFSHKFLRLLLPFAMIGAALSNVFVLFARHPGVRGSLFYLGKPYGEIFLALQSVFYLLAWLGSRFERKGRHPLVRLLYLPTFLVNSNLASLRGFIQFVRGKQTPLWERVPRG
ncbi:MAG: glycosyltransferase family 2 protein [Anaerolineae bacterium]|nr:MAG: glycosyltransferase family 2 protein [Anaerolineae bacterium]